MMTDAKGLLEFLEGGIGMLFDLGLEFLRVEFAPVSPACFRGQRACFGGLQIPINGTPGQVKPPGGLGFGPARLDEVHHPFPQVQRISFHALKPVTLCPNVNMKCYRGAPRDAYNAGWRVLMNRSPRRERLRMGTTRTPALVPIQRSLQLLVHAPDADGYCRHADRVLSEFPDKSERHAERPYSMKS